MEDRFNCSCYLNKVKTNISLIYLKKGLTKFNGDKAVEFHKVVQASVLSKSQYAAITKCTQCIHNSVVEDKKNNTWIIKCPSNVCNVWLEEMLSHHMPAPSLDIAWANSKPQLWPSDAWEMAKFYQPSGCENHTNAEDSDLIGLLSLMQNCTFFRKLLDNVQVLQEIKDLANASMHTGQWHISDADMKKGLDLMISLLEQPELWKTQPCKIAKYDIFKLQDLNLNWKSFLNNELDSTSLYQMVTAVQIDVDGLATEHQELKSATHDMPTRHDYTVDAYNQLLGRFQKFKQRTQEMEKTIETLNQISNSDNDSKASALVTLNQEFKIKICKQIKSLADTFVLVKTKFDETHHTFENTKFGENIRKPNNLPDPNEDCQVSDKTKRVHEFENRNQGDNRSSVTMLETRLQHVENKLEVSIRKPSNIPDPNKDCQVSDQIKTVHEVEIRTLGDTQSSVAMLETRLQHVENKVKDLTTSQQELVINTSEDKKSITDTVQSLKIMVDDLHALDETKVKDLATSQQEFEIKTCEDSKSHADTVQSLNTMVEDQATSKQEFEIKTSEDSKSHTDTVQSLKTMMEDLATSKQEFEIKTSEDIKSHTDTVQSLKTMMEDLATSKQEFEIKTSEDSKSHADTVQSLKTMMEDLATSQQEFEIKTSEDSKSHTDTVQSLKTMMEDLATSQQEFEIKTSEDIKSHTDTVQSLKTMMEDLATSKQEFEIKTSEDIKSHTDTVQSLKTMVEDLATSKQEFEIKTSEDIKSHTDTVQSLKTMVEDLSTSKQEFEIKTSEDSKSHTDTVQSLKTMMEDLATSQQEFEIKTSEDIKSHTDTVQSLKTMMEDLATSKQEFEIKTSEDIKSHTDTVQSLKTMVEDLATSQQEFEIKTNKDINSLADKLESLKTMEEDLHKKVKDLATSQQDINSLADTVQSLKTMVQDLHTKVGRLNHSKYVNWVKTSLSLLYLKIGITKFSDEKAHELHKAVLARVQVVIKNAATTMCTQCTYVNIGKAKKNTSWQVSCNSNICNKWLKEILPHHSRPTKIAWANSNPQRWPSDGWELAKLFQPYGCEKHTRAKDSDCTGLLTLMQDCTFIRNFLKNDTILQEIKEVRNACMHSDDLLINDADMRNGLNLMISLLEETHLKKRQECIDAKKDIVQLRDNVLDLSLKKELESKALIQKMTEVQNDMDRLFIEQQHLKSAQNEMKNRQGNTEEECNQMQDRMKDFEKSVTEMKRSIAPLEKIADLNIDSKVTDLTKRLKEMENRNKECMEDIGNSSPKSLTDEPWREVQYPFSPQYETQLTEEIEHQFTSDRVERANLLLLGPSFAVTRSFCVSVNACVRNYNQLISTWPDDDDIFAPRTGILKDVRLILGNHYFEEVGCNPDDVSYMVNGHLDWDDRMHSVNKPLFAGKPKEKNKIHCVIHVIDAEKLDSDRDTTLKENINQMRDRLNDLGIPQVMVLTNSGNVCRTVLVNISNVYRSVKVKDIVIKASEMFKMPPDLIFPVHHYRFGENDYKGNIPILIALRRVMSLADDFLKKQEGSS